MFDGQTFNHKQNKLSFILDNYLWQTWIEKRIHKDWKIWPNMYWWLAGKRFGKVIEPGDQLVYYADKIDEELQLEERSYLISQTLNSKSYDEVRRTWQDISEVFRSATEERGYNDRYKLL